MRPDQLQIVQGDPLQELRELLATASQRMTTDPAAEEKLKRADDIHRKLLGWNRRVRPIFRRFFIVAAVLPAAAALLVINVNVSVVGSQLHDPSREYQRVAAIHRYKTNETYVLRTAFYLDEYVGTSTASGTKYQRHVAAASPRFPFGTCLSLEHTTSSGEHMTAQVVIEDRLSPISNVDLVVSRPVAKDLRFASAGLADLEVKRCEAQNVN